MKPIFKVAEILNDYSVVINAGENYSLKINQRFLIVDPNGAPIFDPDTKEHLGNLERIVGTGTVKQLYSKMAVVDSDMSISSGTSSAVSAAARAMTIVAFQNTEENTYANYKPFDNPKVGHLAKPI